MKVIQHSGEIVEFNREKLKNSLFKSGANSKVVDDILQVIEKQIYEGISTKKIYKLAFELLKKSSNSQAARYNVKVAIQALGPAGFFFEKYIARLFISEGFQAQTNLLLQGKCVSHEVDVAIKKDNEIAMIECKFHGGKETNSDVKVPMYILSRFNDLKNKRHSIFSEDDEISKCWIVTNNRFTSDAIAFGICSGLNLLSWDYPENYSLSKRIELNHLYPVTCLTTLTVAEKDKLMTMGVIMVTELNENPECLEEINLSQHRIKNVLREASELCKYYVK